MTIYHKPTHIIAMCLLVVFTFAAAHQDYWPTYNAENVLVAANVHAAGSITGDWNTLNCNVKSPFIGTTYLGLIQKLPSIEISMSRALLFNINEYCTFFITPPINAP